MDHLYLLFLPGCPGGHVLLAHLLPRVRHPLPLVPALQYRLFRLLNLQEILLHFSRYFHPAQAKSDMLISRLSTRNAMLDRKAIYDATHPYAPLDTDGQLNFHQAPDYIDVLALEAELGVPTLYNAEFLRRHRFFFQAAYHPFTEEDYREVSRIFHESRNKLKDDHPEKGEL